MGTSLALVGAYVLAGELGAGIDGGIDAVRLAAALDRYHTVMRPYVDRCRKLPERYRRLSAEVRYRHCDHGPGDEVHAALAISEFRRTEWFTTADAVDLPGYPSISSARRA
jgi:hypothetical protein